LTRLGQVLCCERHTLLGKEAGENFRGRQSLLELVVHLQYQGLNERLGLLATRLPNGLLARISDGSSGYQG